MSRRLLHRGLRHRQHKQQVAASSFGGVADDRRPVFIVHPDDLQRHIEFQTRQNEAIIRRGSDAMIFIGFAVSAPASRIFAGLLAAKIYTSFCAVYGCADRCHG